MRLLFAFLLIPFIQYGQEKLYDSTLYQNTINLKNKIQIKNLELNSTIILSNNNSGLEDTLFYTEFMNCNLQLYKSSFDERVFIIKLEGDNLEVLKLLYPKYNSTAKHIWKQYGDNKNELPIYCEGLELLIIRQEDTYSFLLEDMFIL